MHEKPIPGFVLHASNEKQPAHRLLVRHASPQLEFTGVDWAPGSQEDEPVTWHPLTGIVGKIQGAMDTLAQMGRRMLSAPGEAAQDIAASTDGSVESIPYPEGVPPPAITSRMLSGAQRYIAKALPQLGIGPPPPEEAGYILLPDGRRISIPKSTDPLTAAEQGRSQLQSTASKAPTYDAAYNRARARIEERKEAVKEEDARLAMELKKREAAQRERMNELSIRAAELALERETSSPAQRALWGRPSSLAEEAPSRKKLRQIGAAGAGPSLFELY